MGGIGDEPAGWGIAGKVNWIGIGPHKVEVEKRGPLVTFDHFLQFGADAPGFLDLAPKLAGRMYANNVRLVMNDVSTDEQKEIEAILALAKDAPPSGADGARGVAGPAAPRPSARGPAVRKGGNCRPASVAKPVKGCSS